MRKGDEELQFKAHGFNISYSARWRDPEEYRRDD